MGPAELLDMPCTARNGAGCAGDEIARRGRCPVPTVRTRMFHAKHQFKQLLLAQRID